MFSRMNVSCVNFNCDISRVDFNCVKLNCDNSRVDFNFMDLVARSEIHRMWNKIHLGSSSVQTTESFCLHF